ncbi:hypothetical protein ASPACDRAFT_47296 [Aspergillus aculeatus ATCC 16872]|uniref:SnoaL-like domain-containing protein n=1 Tax=Aspergillus aculeatus (strain ATCC 16872 / CBS 172.66 / WB 5094) TaxID=690307 RepID=A0A1L9WID8_ASPA1|nr:uncharacterized protein ASPACDRAFT_47296 [Aspergillus aculeatus ATCC 16872]OJJ95939.1 hypothetical protein ASPACDRAFT_47296 [Aspergillus aculeatus ATCC 16872]
MSLSDHDLIRNAIAHWPLALDQADPRLLSEAFTPDAVIYYPPPVGTLQGIDGLKGLMEAHFQAVTTYHCSGTQVIQLQSPVTATARTYAIGIHFFPGEPGRTPRRIYGYYDDRLVKGAEGWRIAERRVVEHLPINAF